MKELWCEKYRPRRITDYVFKNSHQKEQILKWIEERSIPQLLFTGSPGTGKCIDGSELVDVVVVDTNDHKIMPIKELFEYLDIDSVPYYDTPIKSNKILKILSPTGYVSIRFFVKKQHLVAKYILENGESLACSTQHIVFENNIAKVISDCCSVDTINGTIPIKSAELLGVRDVYDVALDSPHQYITPNGIIHHNTSLAKILFNELSVHEFDILEINASRTNSIDDVRNKIVNFVQMIPFGEFKAVLLDECDFLSINAQAALRGLLEEYHSTARFIFTANYANKIIPALHSRCQGFHIETLDIVEFTTKVAEILISENIIFDLDVLDTFVKSTYPDLRKCINSLQENSINGRLIIPDVKSNQSADYKIEMVRLFKAGHIREARLLLCEQARAEEMEDIYRWLYSNLSYLGTTLDQQEQAIIIIKKGLVGHAMGIDPEINLSATLIQLARNAE